MFIKSFKWAFAKKTKQSKKWADRKMKHSEIDDQGEQQGKEQQGESG